MKKTVPIIYLRSHSPVKLNEKSLNYLNQNYGDNQTKDTLFSYVVCIRRNARRPWHFVVTYSLMSTANKYPTTTDEVFEEHQIKLMCEFVSAPQRIFEPVEIDALLFEGKAIDEVQEEEYIKKWMEAIKLP